MRTREEILADLADVQRRLIDTPDDDFARRFELQTERDRLRRQMSDLGPAPDLDQARSTEELEAEAEALHQQIETMADEHNVDMVMQAGGGGDGWFGAHADFAAINTRISKSTGRAALKARLARLEGLLADRRADE